VALDSVKNGTLVRAAAHILCGTVCVKQVDHICVAFNVTHFDLAVVLVWVVGGVADKGGWGPCGLAFSEQWNVATVQLRIFCVEQFVLSKSIVSVQREFRRKFGDDRQRGAAPSRKIIGQWVRQWRETGSVQGKVRTRQNTIQSPENIQRVGISLERSPRRSVRWHSQLLNLSD